MEIHIEALTQKAIIGILDFEREQPQKVIVDIKIAYHYYTDQFIDYAQIVTLIKENIQKRRYKLLEDALLGLKKEILHHYPAITMLEIKIAKPDIFPECVVALREIWYFET